MTIKRLDVKMWLPRAWCKHFSKPTEKRWFLKGLQVQVLHWVSFWRTQLKYILERLITGVQSFSGFCGREFSIALFLTCVVSRPFYGRLISQYGLNQCAMSDLGEWVYHVLRLPEQVKLKCFLHMNHLPWCAHLCPSCAFCYSFPFSKNLNGDNVADAALGESRAC